MSENRYKDVSSNPYHKRYEDSKRNFIDPRDTAEFKDQFSWTRDKMSSQEIPDEKKIRCRVKRSSSNLHYSRPNIPIRDIVPCRDGQEGSEISPETTRYRPTHSSNTPTEDDQAQYDLNDIELPAMCEDHPDSKLLYLAQTNDDEILCCVYCALEQKQADPHCNVIEIRQYLNDLVNKSKEVLENCPPKVNTRDTSSISAQIMSENDKEIVRIKEYYDKVIDALVQERDEKIHDMNKLITKNVELVSNSIETTDAEKVANFEGELQKVISGVKETGIHIKELQKIRYDFEEVVMGVQKDQPQFDSDETVEKYEFVMLGSDALKDLAHKLASFKVREVPLSYYENGVDMGGYSIVKTRNKDSFRKEVIPSLKNSHDDRRCHKERKRAASIGNFSKNSKTSSRTSKKTKIIMKDKLMSEGQVMPVENIPDACRSYMRDSANGPSQYNTIDREDNKRSKSIESTAFRDVGNIYMSQEHRSSNKESNTKEYIPKYMEMYDQKIISPNQVIYDFKGYHDTSAKMHRVSMQDVNTENLSYSSKSKQMNRRQKTKFSKNSRY